MKKLQYSPDALEKLHEIKQDITIRYGLEQIGICKELNILAEEYAMQRYDWKNTFNTRDLGYTPTMNRNYIKPQRFIRSGNPHTIDNDVKEFLIEHNLKTVIDLRNEKIASMNPNAFISDSRFSCYNFPLSFAKHNVFRSVSFNMQSYFRKGIDKFF
ncbi:MAG: tyrosine-protein phosphatase [Clostridium sp.]|nr:tyrosine-protein phosphatase [Clostridium sp.]